MTNLRTETEMVRKILDVIRTQCRLIHCIERVAPSDQIGIAFT